MIILMVIVIYLLIGAIIGWKEHQIIGEGMEHAMEDMPLNVRKIFPILMTILVIVSAPIMIILWNLPKKKKNKTNK